MGVNKCKTIRRRVTNEELQTIDERDESNIPVTPAVQRQGSIFPDYIPRVADTKPRRTTQVLYTREPMAPLPAPTLQAKERSLWACAVCSKPYESRQSKSQCHKCHLWVCREKCVTRKRVPTSQHQAAFRSICKSCEDKFGL